MFEGLDTFATVKLDGNVILQSDNMFLAHRVDVTQALAKTREEEHVLEIDFDCARRRAEEIQSQHPDHKYVCFNGAPSRLTTRKAQYHWGWDWGPVIMTAGIWRPVRFEVYTARIADLWTDTKLSADYETAEITVSVLVETPTSAAALADRVTFILSLRGTEVAFEECAVIWSTGEKNGKASATFSIKKPSLWWPNGYGVQALYEISASLSAGGELRHSVSKKFGIRMAEVIQRPDKHGKSFFFRINGVDVFCGGSCWIPADSFLPSVSSERYHRWVELMVGGRQVMVR